MTASAIRKSLMGTSLLLHLVVVALAASSTTIDYTTKKPAYIGISFAAAAAFTGLVYTPLALRNAVKRLPTCFDRAWSEMSNIGFQLAYSIAVGIADIVQVTRDCPSEAACGKALPGVTAGFAFLNAVLLLSWLLIDLNAVLKAKRQGLVGNAWRHSMWPLVAGEARRGSDTEKITPGGA